MLVSLRLLVLLGLVSIGCGKKNSSSDGDDSSGSDKIVINSFADVIPKGMAVASPTENLSSEALQSGAITVASLALEESQQSQDFLTKSKKLEQLASATQISECVAILPQEYNLAQGQLTHTSCFGPQVDYSNHPDSSLSSGSFGVGDLGIFTEHEFFASSSTRACAAAVVDNVIDNVGSYADLGWGIHSMGACAAAVNQKDLPSDGEEVDILADVSQGTLKDLTITQASFKNQGGTYQGTFSGSITDQARNLTKNFTLTTKIKSVDNMKKGSFQFIIKDFEDGADLAASFLFNIYADGSVKYRYRQVQIVGANDSHFENEEVKLAGETKRWNEAIVNSNSLGLGKISFVGAVAKLMVFNAETKADGTGYGFFGHSDIEDLTPENDYTIAKGLYCNNQDKSSYVQKQTLKLASSGEWQPAESFILFAPTSTCNWTSKEDPSSSASFKVVPQDEPEQSYDLAFPIENKLYSWSQYKEEWQGPEAPIGF